MTKQNKTSAGAKQIGEENTAIRIPRKLSKARVFS
jgi:hypothetical protein